MTQKHRGFKSCNFFNTLIFSLIFLATQIAVFGTNIHYTIHGNADKANTKIYFSKVDFWAFRPLVFDSMNIDANKHFSKTVVIDGDKPVFVYSANKNLGFLFPRQNIGLHDSVELFLNLETNEFKVLSDVKKHYEFFYSFDGQFRSNAGFDAVYRKHLKLESEAFLDSVFKNYEIKLDVIKQYENNNSRVPFSMIHFLSKTIYYELCSKLDDYQEEHISYFSGKWSFIGNDENLNRAKSKFGLDPNDTWIPDFGYALQNRLGTKTDSLRAIDTVLAKKNILKIKFEVAQNHFRGNIRDYAMCFVIKELIDKARKPRDMRLADSLIAVLESSQTVPMYSEFIKGYSAKKNPFAKNLDFELKSLKGDLWRLSENHSDVKVIFFWGTWCGPCKKQIPFYQQVASDFVNDKNVEFISISIESDSLGSYEKWKTNSFAKSLPGTVLFAGGGNGNAQIKSFNITGVPRIIVIKAGKIVDFNTPMPDSGLKEEIRKLILSN